MTDPTCPKCGQQTTRRIQRFGFLRMKLLPYFGYFPWECAACRNEFVVKNRGDRKQRRKSRHEDPSPSYESANL